MSKFKTVELKGFIVPDHIRNDKPSDPDGHTSIYWRDLSEIIGVKMLPATLTIQIPVEEKKVTITESEFEAICNEGWGKDFLGHQTVTGYLKSKLFGGEL